MVGSSRWRRMARQPITETGSLSTICPAPRGRGLSVDGGPGRCSQRQPCEASLDAVRKYPPVGYPAQEDGCATETDIGLNLSLCGVDESAGLQSLTPPEFPAGGRGNRHPRG